MNVAEDERREKESRRGRNGLVGAEMSLVLGKGARDGHEGPPRMSVFDASKLKHAPPLLPPPLASYLIFYHQCFDKLCEREASRLYPSYPNAPHSHLYQQKSQKAINPELNFPSDYDSKMSKL